MSIYTYATKFNRSWKFNFSERKSNKARRHFHVPPSGTYLSSRSRLKMNSLAHFENHWCLTRSEYQLWAAMMTSPKQKPSAAAAAGFSGRDLVGGRLLCSLLPLFIWRRPAKWNKLLPINTKGVNWIYEFFDKLAGDERLRTIVDTV